MAIKRYKIIIKRKCRFDDKLITSPSDPLYDLQDKYNVKINRSNKSDAVYIFKEGSRRKYQVRVGHPIPKWQKHLHNFKINVQVNKVTKPIVEETIRRYFK